MNFAPKINAYFDFLKFCLNDKAAIPHSIQNLDWEGLYQFGKEQTILGILYHGIEKLSESPYKPDTAIVMKFYVFHQQVMKANKQVYEDAARITKTFKKKYGINTCVMKGQANALMYPDPWSRNPGDIDLWTDTETIDIIKLARKYDAKAEIGYHHIQVEFIIFLLLWVIFSMNTECANSLKRIKKHNLKIEKNYLITWDISMV